MAFAYSVIDIDCHHLIIPEGLLPMGTDLVLTADPARCLLLLQRDVWEPIQNKLLSLTGANPNFTALKRLLIGNARDVSVNATQRLELATELAEFAGLDKNAYWVQTGHHVELWNPEAFSKEVGGSWLSKQLANKLHREEFELGAIQPVGRRRIRSPSRP